ncbi:unnamed protein product [Callosobruchus maculatus]|uniref:Uncharacterized protein n=1 Tax=Callosobruchus maculatus TaxID=64391 RepID=A0A653CBN2_CALMS|nr:unnamed protein product [Callosobruchus maculatus]
MVTPYFSKLCHGHTCLLNAPYPNCRSKNRSTQNFELLHNGLLTISRLLSCSLSTIITLVLL